MIVKRLAWVATAGVLLSDPNTLTEDSVASDIFAKLGDIKGESLDDKHRAEIDVMSFSWGMSQTGISATGGGGGAGKVQVHDFTIVKKTDASSPLLFLNCASGAHIKEATLVVRKAGGEQLEFMKIKLTDVLISSYKPAGAEANLIGLLQPAHAVDVSRDEIPVEQITLNFAKIEFSYQPQGADGKAHGGPILAGWDVKGNIKV
jgi:type VI secretion system secreted protein Hcp